MRKHRLLCFALVGFSALACSSSSNDTTSAHEDSGTRTKDAGADRSVSHPDSGPAEDSSVGSKDSAAVPEAAAHDANQGTTPDSGTGGGADTGVDGGTAMPNGTVLATGPYIGIAGITDDGYVVYDTPNGTYVVSITGGTPTQLAPAGDPSSPGPEVTVLHNDVFVWTNIQETPDTPGTLAVWSHSLGTQHVLSSNSPTDFTVAVSADSSAIVYATDSADGSTWTMFGVTTATFNTPTILGTYTVSAKCSPYFQFTGTASPFYAISTECTPGGDGGVTQSVVAYKSTDWASAKVLASDATSYAIDSTGTSVAVSLPSGQLEIVPLGSGVAASIDSAGALSSGNPSFHLSLTDSFVLYATSAESLKRSPLTGMPAPTTLVSANVDGIYQVSPSEASVFLYGGVASTPVFTFATGLSLASTATPGTPTILSTGSTATGLLGDAFTTDSNFAIYLTNINITDPVVDAGGSPQASALGTLKAVSVADPSNVITLATQSNGLQGSTDLALDASRLSFTDNFSFNDAFGTVDIHVIDLSTTAPSTIVAAGVSSGYMVSHDKKYIVYVINRGGSTDGLYAVAP